MTSLRKRKEEAPVKPQPRLEALSGAEDEAAAVEAMPFLQ